MDGLLISRGRQRLREDKKMTVADAYKTIDKIDEVKQVLYSADVE